MRADARVSPLASVLRRSHPAEQAFIRLSSVNRRLVGLLHYARSSQRPQLHAGQRLQTIVKSANPAEGRAKLLLPPSP